MSLTGDELTINNESYIIIDKNGIEVYLGKLLELKQTYCYYNGCKSNFNNQFVFEKNLIYNDVSPIDTWHNTKLFRVFEKK